MSAMNLRHPILLLSLCGVLLACGKKDEPAPDPDKTAEAAEAGDDEGDKSGATDEADASDEAKDAGAKDEAEDAAGKVRRPGKDRLAGRRPPPLRKDLKAEIAADAGAQPGATTAPEGDAKGGAEDDAGPTVAGAEGGDAKGGAEGGAEGGDAKGGAEGGDAKGGAEGDAGPTVVEVTPAVAPTPAMPATVEGQPELPVRPAAAPGIAPGPAARAGQPATGQPFYDAARLLPLPTALEITQAKNLAPAGVLAGIAASPNYGSVFYKAPTAADFGVSVQAWHDPARRESDDRFRRMRLQYPNAEDVQVLAPVKAFFAQFGKIQMITFVDSVKRIVVSVGCGEGICTHDELVKLAKAVRERL